MHTALGQSTHFMNIPDEGDTIVSLQSIVYPFAPQSKNAVSAV